MRYKLKDLARVIRSKNSGPYELTFDVMFRDYDMYRRVADAKVFTPASFAALYGIPAEDVMEIVCFEPAKAVKITIARPLCSGSPGETDVYGAQQHAPLMGMEFEI